MDHEEHEVDGKRRRFLTVAATVVGGTGAAMAAVPFVIALQPSERARAEGGPIEVEIDQIEPGQMIRALWQGKPVWVVRRTPEGLKSLEGHDDALRDPDFTEPNQPPYATNRYLPEYLILIGICTYLGCLPVGVSAKRRTGVSQIELLPRGAMDPTCRIAAYLNRDKNNDCI